MIIFTLTMPGVGSWNGRWSGENNVYAIKKPDRSVPKEIIGKSFYYRWDDGWAGNITVESVSAAEANKIMRKSKGFCGYDWMVRSLIKHGEILTAREQQELEQEQK
jgi:hypothetical protein